MHLQAWLKSYITRAFDGVTLDDGVDIHTAKFLDSYGFDDEGFTSIHNYCAIVRGCFLF